MRNARKDAKIVEREPQISVKKGAVQAGREDYRGLVALVLCVGLVVATLLARVEAVAALSGLAGTAVGWYFSSREGKRR